VKPRDETDAARGLRRGVVLVLPDAHWDVLGPLLPQRRPDQRVGGQRIHDRRMILSAIFYQARTGCRWQDLPPIFPPEGTVYDYFQKWRRDGTLERVYAAWSEQFRGDNDQYPQFGVNPPSHWVARARPRSVMADGGGARGESPSVPASGSPDSRCALTTPARSGYRSTMERFYIRVDGPPLLRQAFRNWLVALPGVLMSERAGAIQVLVGSSDLEGPVIRDLQGERGAAKCVFVTAGSRSELVAAAKMGIRVFVGFADEPSVMLQALAAAEQAVAYCSPTLVPALVYALGSSPSEDQVTPRLLTRAGDLSQREIEVALLAARGLSNKQISSEVHLSIATVKFHLSKVYRKLEIPRRSLLRQHVLPT